jgi:hypothetical protein
MVNLSSGLTGLSLLSGTDAFSAFSSSTLGIESRAVRLAKAAFTTKATTPPWKEAMPSTSEAVQMTIIKAMASIIDKPKTGTGALPDDVQTSFIAFKALDRLRLLAQGAAKTGTSEAQRASLDKSFQKGLSDLQTFLGTAPSDALKLSFHQPLRHTESVPMTPTIPGKTVGAGLVANRTDPLPGLTGNEVFQIRLSKTAGNDMVTVDLSTTPQPPTIDSVTAAINAAIASVPMRDTSGNIVLNPDGSVQKRYSSTFAAERTTIPSATAGGTPTYKWGMALNGVGSEHVAIDQVGGQDSIVVATAQTALDSPSSVRMMRFDDPTGAMAQKTLATIASVDREATERAAMTPPTKNLAGVTAAAPTIYAETRAQAIATDAEGFSYVVGTAEGDMGSNRLAGEADLFLTKVDSEGKTVWQRTMGVGGSAEGAAISIGADGKITVAGTVRGELDGTDHRDSDMLVARFDADGDEQFTTVIRNSGDDVASAVAVGADGSIYVGGKTGAGSSDGFLSRLDASGRLQERRVIDSGGSEKIVSLAISGDGQLLALTNETGIAKVRKIDATALATDLGSIDLGTADARAIAVDTDGSIAVGGARATGASRDGFVARIDAGLGAAAFTDLATGADDQVDSLAFMNGQLYAGGRTAGDLGGTRKGAVDGFVARIDAAGAIARIDQFGQAALRTEPVRIAASVGGASKTGALGFGRGTINPAVSARLEAQTSLRAGDEFSLRVNDGTVRKIVIADNETLATLADKVRKITGNKATVTTPRMGGGNVFKIEAKAGESVELIAGHAGRDALAKLGIEPVRISTPPPTDPNAPKVRPGGTFGLNLTEALSIGTATDAATALSRIKSALSTTQTGYRSLYWDDLKAAQTDGTLMRAGGSDAGTARIQAQMAQYQAALTRLQSGASPTLGF